MKHSLKFPILFIVIAFSACRSHKTVEVSNSSANDSCIVQTDLSVHSLTNIEKTESISSCIAQDHLEFSDGAGEIKIHPNGEVSIKGLKSAYLMHQNTHKQSEASVVTSDSITATSQEKSTKTTTSATKTNTSIPISSSTWIKIIFFIIIIILIIKISRSR